MVDWADPVRKRVTGAALRLRGLPHDVGMSWNRLVMTDLLPSAQGAAPIFHSANEAMMRASLSGAPGLAQESACAGRSQARGALLPDGQQLRRA
jgi:hypothetical protein